MYLEITEHEIKNILTEDPERASGLIKVLDAMHRDGQIKIQESSLGTENRMFLIKT